MKRYLTIVGMAFAAIYAFSVMAAGNASAFTVWDECMEVPAGTGLFNSSDCNVKGEPFNWEWLEITAAQPTDSLLAVLTLTSNGTVLDCEGFVDGFVGPGGQDEVTEILNEEGLLVTSANQVTCTTLVAGLCSPPALAYPVHLPWKTALVAAGDELLSGGTGSPGWSVTCDGNGLKIECTRATAILKVENLEAELEVDETFNPLEEAICEPGKTKGTVEGTVSVLLANAPERALRAM